MAAPDLPAATLVERVQRAMPGVEEIRRLPSGAIVAYGFDGEQAQAFHVDPVDGRALAAYRPSQLPRWVKNLHRSLLLGDAGRWGAAGIALAMALLSISGLVLLLRRMGGWRQLVGRVRGPLAQRLHVQVGRVLLAVLCLTSLTALYMSATTLGLVALDAGPEPDVVSVAGSRPSLPGAQLPALQGLRVQDLRKLNFPDAADPEDVWTVTTRAGQGWIDRYTGQTLVWQDATTARRLYDWAVVLHTGESAWPWAVVLGLVGASVLLFWITGLLIWWQARRQAVRITDNSPLTQADVLVFVASEGGSTWGFAQTLHDALVRCGHRVHTSGLEHFQTAPATRQVFVLAATYGEGQAPTHARAALERIAGHARGAVPVTVLGFGDRQYPAFCAFAQALEQALRARGWPALLPLESIHQQSSQQFARWGEALAQALGEPLVLDHVPRVPPTTALTLISRQDYPGQAGRPTAILRFDWPRPGWRDRLRGHGLAQLCRGRSGGHRAARLQRAALLLARLGQRGRIPGNLRAPVAGRPVLHPPLRSATGRHGPGLHPAQPGFRLCTAHGEPWCSSARARAWLRWRASSGATTGAPPCTCTTGGATRRWTSISSTDIQRWLGEQRLASVRTAFSRVPGGGYVQDALRRDAPRLRELLARGAIVRVCGSRPMAGGVTEALDEILGTLQSSVQQLKAKGRYAEDLF